VKPFLTLGFTKDKTVKRVCWVMASAILFNILITLAGQPNSFWHDPHTAIRGDGLSIYNATNHMFLFFLESGWVVFLIATSTYLLVMYLLVTFLPARLALITMCSLIFAHYYDGSNWLAVRWHMGIQGPFLYGLAIAAGITQAAFPYFGNGRSIKSLRWIAIFAMLTDALVTLYGQPRGYWHNSSLVDEGNAASKYFLMQGWFAYALEQAVICSGIFYLVSIFSKRWGLFTVLCFILGGFTGASNWFFYRWIWGMQGPVIFGVILSAAMVLLVVKPTAKTTTSPAADESKQLITGAGKKDWLPDECC
jgi:hypothetical protein